MFECSLNKIRKSLLKKNKVLDVLKHDEEENIKIKSKLKQ